MMAPLAADIQRADPAPKTQVLDLKKVFADAPLIYSLLLVMSMSSVVLWLYTLATFRAKEIMPKSFVDELRLHLKGQEYDKALAYCQGRPNLLASIVAAGLATRKHGPQVMIDAMKSEGKRASASFWQKLSLLNDIAIVAPMLGLLGTVIGMFYAFYDVNRSIESINALFDGLGIAVGTTVAGLIVSIVSMIFSTTLKYRLVKNLSLVENEALVISSQVEGKWN
jgi:biopolymer transport protein ExbB